MEVSVIIINFNTFHLTSECIRSVIEHTQNVRYEIILVDNASSECDASAFLSQFPGVRLIQNETNIGFAAGNNAGIAGAKGEFILLLNSDTLLSENSIEKCLSYMRRVNNAGVIGCRMIYPSGGVQHTARKFRSISWELLDLFRFIPMLMTYKKRSRLMLGKYFRCDENIECDWVNGAFFLFHRKLLNMWPDKKLDERFFMYGEDQLWCWQVKQKGLEVHFYPGTTIIHVGGASTAPAKQIAQRKLMMKRELDIMRLRKGRGTYYYFFTLVFGAKESVRNFFRLAILKLTGRMVR